MQSIDHLMDKIATKISEHKTTEGTLYFSKIDLKYAYSQLPLHPDTQKHCTSTYLEETPLEHTDFLTVSTA